MSATKDSGCMKYKPKVGDFVLLNTYEPVSEGSGHVGIVVEVNSDNFIAVEGNTGSSNFRTSKVQKLTYKRTSTGWARGSVTVHGFCSPDYPS